MKQLVFAMLIVAGCGSNGEPMRPPAEFPFATVSRDCAPFDGPAVTIYLTPTAVALDPSPPFVRISVWDAPEQVAGRTWTWPRTVNKATASRCVTGNDCVDSTSGSVTLGNFGPDSALSATVDVKFPDGSRIQGTVRGTWQSRRILCG
jgi:hypothetical protein